MREFCGNHYERAFQNWLIDHRVEYVVIDEHKRAAFAKRKVKSFDLLVYRPDGGKVIAEVKGRKFRGTSLEKLTRFECWVTAEDVDGLDTWREVFGPGHEVVFVFAYKVENVDVDFDGAEAFEYSGRRYLFFCVKLEDYRRYMKRRSPKWQTVTLSAENFRRSARPADEFFL